MNDDKKEKSLSLCLVSAPSASLRDSFLSSAEKTKFAQRRGERGEKTWPKCKTKGIGASRRSAFEQNNCRHSSNHHQLRSPPGLENRTKSEYKK
jgi:hypothetical protein